MEGFLDQEFEVGVELLDIRISQTVFIDAV